MHFVDFYNILISTFKSAFIEQWTKKDSDMETCGDAKFMTENTQNTSRTRSVERHTEIITIYLITSSLG